MHSDQHLSLSHTEYKRNLHLSGLICLYDHMSYTSAMYSSGKHAVSGLRVPVHVTLFCSGYRYMTNDDWCYPISSRVSCRSGVPDRLPEVHEMVSS